MVKKSNSGLISLLLIILVIIISVIVIINRGNGKEPAENVAECIGQKAVLYIQLGCRACEAQEELFGENYQYITSVDCYKEREKCEENNITATPTWIIQGEKYVGVRSIEELKELTGC